MTTFSTPVQPRQIRLELTLKCNAHCASCGRSRGLTRPIGDMSRELVEKCLNDIRSFPEPLDEVVPTGFGELFLAPGWPELLQLIAKRLPKTPMVVPTNGTLLRNGAINDLCRVPTLKLVNISVNAFLPETYEAFHGLSARHMETIERSAKRIRELRPDVTLWISMVRDSRYQSPKEAELFQEKWSKIGIVQMNQAEYAGVIGREPLCPVKLPCRSLLSDLVVNWDGRVTSCCYDADCNLVVGDVCQQSLLDIWHGREFSKLRDLHNSGRRREVGLCSSCTFA